MRSLNGKVAVIAGGSKGIGAGVALALAREGCDVALIARRTALLEGVAAKIRDAGSKAVICSGDLAVQADVVRMTDTIKAELGRVDILYNGVAGNLEADIFGAEPEKV